MPFFAPVPWEADRFFAPAGHGGEEPHPGLVAGRYRALHADGEQSERAHGARAQSQFPRRGLSVRGRAGRRRSRAAGRCRQDRCRSSTRRCSRARRKAFPTGTSSCRATTTPPASARTTSTRRCAFASRARRALTERWRRRGIRLDTSVATTNLLPRRSTGSIRWWAGSSRARAQAAPGDLHRDRLRGIHLDLPQRPRHPRAGPDRRPASSATARARTGINPVIYDWVDGKPQRKPIEAAKKLLAEAGYPDGRDAKTGQPLVLYLDTTAAGPDDKSRLDWCRKQFAKIDLQLESAQHRLQPLPGQDPQGQRAALHLGWNADYPDPENFLFLLHGPQSRAKSQGENAANYDNPEFDALFERMKNMANGPERQTDHRPHDRDRRATMRPGSGASTRRTTACSTPGCGNVKPNQMARQQAEVPARRCRAARAAARASGTSRCCGRSCCCCSCWCWSSVPAVATLPRRERMAARPAADDDRLHHPPHAVRDPDPDRGQPAHLRAVLRGQHARRHGAHAARREARDAGGDREVEGRARLRQAAAAGTARRRARASSPTPSSSRNRCACSSSISAAPTTAATSPTRSATRMWPSLALALPVFLVGLAVNITFALLMAFFRATYLDFWGVVLCVAMMSISGAVLHHRRAVPGHRKLWHLVPISGYAGGLDALQVPRPAGGDRRDRRHRRRAAAGTARSSSRRSARTMCAPRAPRACPRRAVLFRHVLKNAHDPDPHRRGGGDPAAVHGQPADGILLRHSRAWAATPSTRSRPRTSPWCARWCSSARCSTSSACS